MRKFPPTLLGKKEIKHYFIVSRCKGNQKILSSNNFFIFFQKLFWIHKNLLPPLEMAFYAFKMLLRPFTMELFYRAPAR